jgi:ATP-dependent 26S proteasome regulatory subunit
VLLGSRLIWFLTWKIYAHRYDNRVKAMEVIEREKLTEDYSDIGGLDKEV